MGGLVHFAEAAERMPWPLVYLATIAEKVPLQTVVLNSHLPVDSSFGARLAVGPVTRLWQLSTCDISFFRLRRSPFLYLLRSFRLGERVADSLDCEIEKA
jgi:hypothetical protein